MRIEVNFLGRVGDFMVLRPHEQNKAGLEKARLLAREEGYDIGPLRLGFVDTFLGERVYCYPLYLVLARI